MKNREVTIDLKGKSLGKTTRLFLLLVCICISAGSNLVYAEAAESIEKEVRAGLPFGLLLYHSHSPRFHNWIEGNVVVTPDGKVVNILRTNGQGKDKAVIVHISDDGMTLSYNPQRDFIDFPGGGSKFTIRFDDKTRRYLSLTNKQTNPEAGRNVLVLISSADLRNWRVERTVLSHPNREKIGFHYADWLIEGDDIIFTLRTAYFDGQGGPSDRHDNNYITFHRIEGFRKGLGY